MVSYFYDTMCGLRLFLEGTGYSESFNAQYHCIETRECVRMADVPSVMMQIVMRRLSNHAQMYQRISKTSDTSFYATTLFQSCPEKEVVSGDARILKNSVDNFCNAYTHYEINLFY